MVCITVNFKQTLAATQHIPEHDQSISTEISQDQSPLKSSNKCSNTFMFSLAAIQHTHMRFATPYVFSSSQQWRTRIDQIWSSESSLYKHADAVMWSISGCTRISGTRPQQMWVNDTYIPYPCTIIDVRGHCHNQCGARSGSSKRIGPN